MSTTSAASLVRLLQSDGPLTTSVLVDYFGEAALKEEHVDILRGIYYGMVCLKFVPAELLHNCFLTNRLDELIRLKYVHWRSGYYHMLVEQGVTVGRTCPLPTRVDALPLLDDDHCASCGAAGYVLQGNRSFGAAPDCEGCFKGMCRLCVVRVDESCVCSTCAASSQH